MRLINQLFEGAPGAYGVGPLSSPPAGVSSVTPCVGG